MAGGSTLAVTITYPKGDSYEGEAQNGLRNEHGVYAYANGNRYVGKYKNGVRDGQGTFSSANGLTESGVWQSAIGVK